jgi:hypothetical protein
VLAGRGDLRLGGLTGVFKEWAPGFVRLVCWIASSGVTFEVTGLEESLMVLVSGTLGNGFRGMVAGLVVAGSVALAQTTAPPHKAKAPAKTALAVWTPEVQQKLGVSASDFPVFGLNKLSKVQLTMLLSAARPDPKKYVLSCAASTLIPGSMIHVLLTVAGDDSTGAIAGQIRQQVGSLSGVDVVDVPALADRALNVVIQEQTMGKRTIGFTASYLTGTPCTEVIAGKQTDVELKGTLGTYTDAKGAGLASDLAGMLDQDLQPLRRGVVSTQ